MNGQGKVFINIMVFLWPMRPINQEAVRNIDKIIRIFLREAKKRNAPVFRFESFNDEFEALVKIILSSRTRDEKTIETTGKLFKRIKNPRGLIEINQKELEELVRGVAFYREKARKLKKLGEILVERYNGKIPREFKELVKLPGIGRKTANVFLASFHKKQAIGVDIHVHRISNRIGLVKTNKAEETEKELQGIIPKRYWNKINKAFVAYGQTICKAKPKCNECKIREMCWYYRENMNSGERI